MPLFIRIHHLQPLFLSLAKKLHHPYTLIRQWDHEEKETPDSPDSTEVPSPEILMWTVFLVTCGLSETSEATSDWMRFLRFPRFRISGIERLMELAGPDGITGQPLPETPRNIRRLNQRYGESWVSAARHIRDSLSQVPTTVRTLTENTDPLPTGKQLLAALPSDRTPVGPAFGALLECLHLALYERPDLNTPEDISLLLHSMSSAFPMNQ